MLVARNGGADPTLQTNYLLSSHRRGRARRIVAVRRQGLGPGIGQSEPILLTSLVNGFTILGISQYYQPVAVGAVVLDVRPASPGSRSEDAHGRPTDATPTRRCSRRATCVKTFDAVRALDGLSIYDRSRSGHRDRRRQRRRQVDPGALPDRRPLPRRRRDPRSRASRVQLSSPEDARSSRRGDGLPGPRPRRGPHGVAEPLPQPRAAPRPIPLLGILDRKQHDRPELGDPRTISTSTCPPYARRCGGCRVVSARAIAIARAVTWGADAGHHGRAHGGSGRPGDRGGREA